MSENEPIYENDKVNVKNELVSKILDVSCDILRGAKDDSIITNVVLQNLKACINSYNSPEVHSPDTIIQYLTDRLRELSEISDDIPLRKSKWIYGRIRKIKNSFEIRYLGKIYIVSII